jgi:hypothetical protein
MCEDVEGDPPVLTWTPDPASPGIRCAVYEGHTLRMVAVGWAEYDVIVDNAHRVSGSDTVRASEAAAIRFIDKVELGPEPAVYLVPLGH